MKQNRLVTGGLTQQEIGRVEWWQCSETESLYDVVDRCTGACVAGAACLAADPNQPIHQVTLAPHHSYIDDRYIKFLPSYWSFVVGLSIITYLVSSIDVQNTSKCFGLEVSRIHWTGFACSEQCGINNLSSHRQAKDAVWGVC